MEAILQAKTRKRIMNITKYKLTISAAAFGLILAFAVFGQTQIALQLFEEGFALERKGDCKNAVIAYQKALEKQHSASNERSDTLRALGRCYTNEGEYAKSLDYFQQSLNLKKQIGNNASAAEVMIRLAQLYLLLGDKGKAVELSQEALPFKAALITPRNEYSLFTATVMHNIGLIFYNVSQSLAKDKYYSERSNVEKLSEKYHFDNYEDGAVFYFEKAFDIRMALKDSRGAGQSLTAIADVLKDKFSSGERYRFQPTTDWSKTLNADGKPVDEAAFLMYQRANLLFTRAKDSNGRAYALMNMAELKPERLKSDYSSLKLYDDALLLARLTHNKRVEATILGKLMEIQQKTATQLAIIYGKQSINICQQLRVNIRTLDVKTQKSFLKTIEPTYRSLADILIAEDRFPEAQAVLDLLKDEEYEQLSRSGERAGTVPYSQSEIDVIDKIENLVALEQKRDGLQKIQKETGTLSDEQLKRFKELDSKIDAANKAFKDSLDALGKSEVSVKDLVNEIEGRKELQGALTRLGAKTKSGVVALYTVLGTEDVEDGREGQNYKNENEIRLLQCLSDKNRKFGRKRLSVS